MQRLIAFLLTGILSALVLFACNNQRRVQAGREENQPGGTETYQPVPAPGTTAGQEIRGELRRVDMAKKTFVVRTDNGLEQTFRFDDGTSVSGIPPTTGNMPSTNRQKPGQNIQMSSLVGKEGSEMTIHWTQQGDDKVATSSDVSQIGTKGKSKTY